MKTLLLMAVALLLSFAWAAPGKNTGERIYNNTGETAKEKPTPFRFSNISTAPAEAVSDGSDGDTGVYSANR